MTSQKSLVVVEKQGPFELRDTSIPTPGPGELLVEIQSVSLNPVDWMMQVLAVLPITYPAVLGCDAAGIVKEVGEGVTSFAVGDRVLHAGERNPREGIFQQYTIAKAEYAAKIPINLTFDQASAVPLTLTTAACGLYCDKQEKGPGGAGLAIPWEEGGRGKYSGEPIVVLGTSSSVGQYIVQLAKLSGFSPIIVTASAKNEEYLKSLGATHVLDRNIRPLASLPEAVSAITAKLVKIIYDAVSSQETYAAAFETLAPGGTIIHFPSIPHESNHLSDGKHAATVFGSPRMPTQRAFGLSLYKHLTGLLETGDLKPNNVEVVPGGLLAIPGALERLRAGVSALKLVVHPQEGL